MNGDIYAPPSINKHKKRVQGDPYYFCALPGSGHLFGETPIFMCLSLMPIRRLSLELTPLASIPCSLFHFLLLYSSVHPLICLSSFVIPTLITLVLVTDRSGIAVRGHFLPITRMGMRAVSSALLWTVRRYVLLFYLLLVAVRAFLMLEAWWRTASRVAGNPRVHGFAISRYSLHLYSLCPLSLDWWPRRHYTLNSLLIVS